MTSAEKKSRKNSKKKKKHIDPMQYVLKKPEEYRSKGIQKWAWNRRLAIMQKVFGYRFHNLDNLPVKGPGIIIANHTSMMDIPALFGAANTFIFFIAKSDLFQNPLLAAIMRWWGAIPVDRERLDIGTVRAIRKRLAEEQVVVIFPQASRVFSLSDTWKYPPESGALNFALRARVPIYPCFIGDRTSGKHKQIICGPKIKPEELNPGGVRITKDMLNELTFIVMSKIYALGGFDYQVLMERPAEEELISTRSRERRAGGRFGKIKRRELAEARLEASRLLERAVDKEPNLLSQGAESNNVVEESNIRSDA